VEGVPDREDGCGVAGEEEAEGASDRKRTDGR
jgi:hypothetical protein